MKFSVEVETESHLYDSIPDGMKETPTSLQWDIQVKVEQKAAEQIKTKSEAMTPKKSMITLPPATPSSGMKKMSSTSELLARMGKGRKVAKLNFLSAKFYAQKKLNFFVFFSNFAFIQIFNLRPLITVWTKRNLS